MIAIGRIVAATVTNDDELTATNDESRATEWASPRHILLTVGVSLAAAFDDLSERLLCVVGAQDADEDGVTFFAASIVSARSNDEHEIVALKTDRLVSIRPDNLVGGRLLISRDDLDEWQLSVAETLTAYLPTRRQCELV